MLIFAVFIYFLFDFVNSEPPKSTCSPEFPILLRDFSCENFQNICFKKGDKECDLLQNACKQCPPSEITMIMLKNVTYRITEIELQSERLKSMLTNSTVSNKVQITEIIGIINASREIVNWILAIIVLLILLRFISFLVRNCYISRSRKLKCHLEEKHILIPEDESTFEKTVPIRGNLFKDTVESVQECSLLRKDLSIPELYGRRRKIKLPKTRLRIRREKIFAGHSMLQNPFNTESVLIILKKLDDLTMMLNIKTTDVSFCTIQFQFDDVNKESIELYVHNNHNIVQVKQQICAKLLQSKHDDYKIMKLKYNGIILNDDNQYLLENIDKSNAIVNCFIDSSKNASDIVVVKLQGKMRLPDIIQINKNQTIDQLKELIGKIINSKEFSLFKHSNESNKAEELKENLNNLKDGNWIRIVTKEFGRLVIRSIFDDEDSIRIEYVNVDLVSSLMTSISNKFNWDLNNFVLFYNNKCLEAKKYIFEYQISSESAVKYCFFMKWAGVKMDEDNYITKGNFSELLYGTSINTNRKILIKKYEVKSSKNWKDEEFMLKELITFQITKSHRRFIQLLGVYIDDTILYVVMENMDGGTLKTFLQDNHEKLNKNKIYKWSAQILEGLKFLHENKVIHRDLNPSSILVDGNEDLKLSSFNLSKYLDISKPSSIMAKRDKKEELPVRYMAPEILNSGNYGEACDVWSFGAVLIRIITNKKPYSNSTKSEALNKISQLKMIEYKLPDKYSEFKSIIDSCLKYDPSKRETISKLMSNNHFKNYVIPI